MLCMPSNVVEVYPEAWIVMHLMDHIGLVGDLPAIKTAEIAAKEESAARKVKTKVVA